MGCNVAAAALVYFFLYESVSLSLENVDCMYGQAGVKAWTWRKWVPEGYVTRKKRDEAYWEGRGSGGGGEGRGESGEKSGEGSRDGIV